MAYGALAILDTIPMPVYSLNRAPHLPPTPGQLERSDILSQYIFPCPSTLLCPFTSRGSTGREHLASARCLVGEERKSRIAPTYSGANNRIKRMYGICRREFTLINGECKPFFFFFFVKSVVPFQVHDRSFQGNN